MEKDLPDSSSPYARLGTAAHELAAIVLQNPPAQPSNYLGMEIKVAYEIAGEPAEEIFVVDEEMAEAVKVYTDVVRGLLTPNTDHGIETRISLAPLKPPIAMFGTTDCWIWHPEHRHLDVLDYKHGIGVVVEPEKNSQAMYYALGTVLALGKRPDHITLHIIQPRAPHTDGPHRWWDMKYEELVEFRHELMADAAATQEPDAPLVPGDWCRFCKAQATCPALHAEAVEVTGELLVQDEPTELAEPERLSLEQVQRVLTVAPTLKKWLEAVQAHAHDLIVAGQEVPGWKLVPKRVFRKWKDDEAAATFAMRHGIEAYGEKVLTPAQMETNFKRAGLDPALLEEFILAESNGYNLATEDDSRTAIDPAAEAKALLLPAPQGEKRIPDSGIL